MDALPTADEMRQRTLLFLTHPRLWKFWPFLPLVRRKPGSEEEVGLVYDALHAIHQPGHSCTVYKCNLFLLPSTPDELFAMPKEVFDCPEELVGAQWTVD